MTIEQRLDQLERRNRRLTATPMLLPIALCAVLTLYGLPTEILAQNENTQSIGFVAGPTHGIWRNVVHDPSRYDAEMTVIDGMVDLDQVEESTHHIRALISRFDAVAHYRAEENLALLAKAIGSGTYPGYPAVDVLARSWHVDEERRVWFLSWSRALSAWARGETSDVELTLDGQVVVLGDLLGERNRDKEWLAASLGKTLKCFVETPADRVSGLSDETFVRAVYRSALGRDPSPDDLGFRLRELATGKGREAFVQEVFASDEAHAKRLHQILDRAADVDGGN
jgi:hypothetical protein